jgi:DNA-binding transcriptional LysR family regulator
MASLFPIPLNAVRAIEIVARRGALAPAAEELGVTPGAVSQHIRRAEERLGVDLFERTPAGLVPTPALKAIVSQLSSGFGTLAEAVAGLRGTDEHVLTLTVASVFASRWLIWRIGKFSALHPDIQVRLVVTGKLLELGSSGIDCGIRYGGGDWPGTRGELIGGQTYGVVVAPLLAPQLKTPADLASISIIEDTRGTLSWDAWFATAGIARPERHGPSYDDPTIAFDAAISGQGALLAVELMSADAVSDGRLVRPFNIRVTNDTGYWFVTPEGRREPKKTQLFRDWLRAEVPDSVDGYVAQMARRGQGT